MGKNNVNNRSLGTLRKFEEKLRKLDDNHKLLKQLHLNSKQLSTKVHKQIKVNVRKKEEN